MANAKLPDALCLSGLRGFCNVLNLHVFVGRIRRSRRIRHEQRALCQQSETRSVSPRLRLMANAKLPDALCLSGLRGFCNVLNLHVFVGRIRRSRRIRHEQRALCQQSETRSVSPRLRLMANAKLPDALCLSGLRGFCNVLNLHVFVGRIRRSRRIRHEQRALCQQSETRSVPPRFLSLSIARTYHFLFNRRSMLYAPGPVIASSRNPPEIVRFFINISEFMPSAKLL